MSFIGRVGKLKMMKRRLSEAALKVGVFLQDKRDPSCANGKYFKRELNYNNYWDVLTLTQSVVFLL